MTSEPAKRFCTNCGGELGETDAFCPTCGTRVTSTSDAPSPAAPTPPVAPPQSQASVEAATRSSPQLDELLARLSLPEKLIAGGGALMFIASFLPWYRQPLPLDLTITYSGWEGPGAFFSVLALLVALAMAGQVIGTKLGSLNLPAPGDLTWAMVHLGAAGVIIVLMFLRLISLASYMSFGFFVGIIAAGLLAVGAYLMYNEEKSGAVRS